MRSNPSSSRQNPKHRKATGIGLIVGVSLVIVFIFGMPLFIPQPKMAHDQIVATHYHATIKIVNGQLPEGIGVKPEFWKGHKLDEYGIQGQAPIHTHDNSGTIHIESKVIRFYTIGDLLDIWGVDGGTVTAYSGDSKEPLENPRDVVIADGDTYRLEFH